MNFKNKIIFIIFIIVVIFYFIKNYFKFELLNVLILKRGLLAPNKLWYNISDLLLDDPSGINFYNNIKKEGEFIKKNMFGTEIIIVTNIKYIKIILNNSPNIFSVGNLKKQFFKSFMEKNVGVSKGCPWKQRRKLNEHVLTSDKLHIYSEKYNNYIENVINDYKNNNLTFENFNDIGKNIVTKIIFNKYKIHDDIFNIFSEANSIYATTSDNFKINEKIYNNYKKILFENIKTPEKHSFFDLSVEYQQKIKCNKNYEKNYEIFHQIPHFIFPLIGLFITTIPRLLMILTNHKKIFTEVINEINSIKDKVNVSKQIYELKILRKCVLEMLRLNNPVTTTFRTLEKDFIFDKKYKFKKNTQFLILNNPVLRDTNFFKNPNKFNPYRWNKNMEESYYSLSFNQGPQKCPGKELSIFLIQSFIYNIVKIKKINVDSIKSNKINTNYIPQIINPFNIEFEFK